MLKVTRITMAKEGDGVDLDAIKKAYRRYARIYDFYFGAVLQPGRKAVINVLKCRPGDRILEVGVGVGTGLSLPLYPAGVTVTGIDVSAEMLERAQERTSHLALSHVRELRIMDAENMNFADNSFDKVVAMYVASVVPHPALVVDEMRRVCRPEGEIFIVNHFRAANPFVGTVEKLFAPLSQLMGFRPDFCLDDFIRETQLEVIDKKTVNLFGYWTLLRARNNKLAQEALAPLGASA